MKFVILNNMKLQFLIVSLVFGFFNLSAQMMPGVKFDKLSHDFGDIKEEAIEVRGDFKFVNTGTSPLYISNITTSCGCTKPIYTKDTLLPGDTGTLTAIYETRGKEGSFHKSLFVYFNGQEWYQTLTIQGYVIPQANLLKKPEQFNTTFANLAFTAASVDFKDILNTEVKTVVLKAYNFQGYPMKIYQVKGIPDFLQVNIGDSVIRSSDSLTFTFKADGSKIKNIGGTFSRIELVTDDALQSSKFLFVYTNLKEDFSKMTKKERQNAPKIEFSEKFPLNYGSNTAGAKVNKTVKITNTGKTPMKIHGLKPSCSCVTYRLGKQILEPGESVDMVITIDTVNQSIAEHSKYLTIYTNVPGKQEINLKLIINITN
jgi:hypothetical protein